MIVAEIHWKFKFDQMTDEQFEVLKNTWPCFDKERTREHLHSLPKQRLSIEEAAILQAADIPLEIEGVDGTMITKMRDRGKQWGWENRDVKPSDILDGNAVQITIPDMALLFFNKVTWMEDACTEELQAKLDEGWRILAVCPPNAQRRPDYILGRRE